MARGGGTVNAHETEDMDGLFTTSGTLVQMSCASSCPQYCCFDANTHPDHCGGSLAC